MDPLSASIVSAYMASSQAQVSQQVQIAMFKKAMDLEASAAMALIQALPPPMPAGSVLGSLINVYA